MQHNIDGGVKRVEGKTGREVGNEADRVGGLAGRLGEGADIVRGEAERVRGGTGKNIDKETEPAGERSRWTPFHRRPKGEAYRRSEGPRQLNKMSCSY